MLAQSSDFVVCAGKGFTLASTAVGTQPVTYQWFENGAAIDNSDNALLSVHEGKAAGTYAYVCKASSEACTDPLPSNTYTVEVLALPATPTITAPTAVCQGTDVVFGVANPVAGATYTWSGNAGGTVSGTGNRTCTVSGATYGEKQVSAYASRVINGMTCRSADASPMIATVVMQPTQPDLVRRTSNPTVACIPNNFIVMNPNPLYTYEWYSNYSIDALNDAKTSCTVTAPGSHGFDVSVTAIYSVNSITCSSEKALLSTSVPALKDEATAPCAAACQNAFGEDRCWNFYSHMVVKPNTKTYTITECTALCTSYGKRVIRQELAVEISSYYEPDIMWEGRYNTPIQEGKSLASWPGGSSFACWCQHE